MEGRCRGAFHSLRMGRKDIPHYVWRGWTSRIMRGEGGYLFICRYMVDISLYVQRGWTSHYIERGWTSHYMYREGGHLIIYREGGHLII